ncbi:9035_t:CDS:2 [Cetraspora pellucida]|uniref:9035_t:CDS:1 n=1 Tax=Cetraspora pellucida TaxID=1433469 RepID=A0A9N9ER46_9GLOM|nr:9035_t:CDS:2 [Cetraspora pellucida]
MALGPSYELPKFELQNITQAIHQLKYPHTGSTIATILKSIMQDWNIFEKYFMITTVNAKNMIKAISKIEEAKQLIQFFMSLKQSKQLEIAQALLNHKIYNNIAISSLKKLLNINNNIVTVIVNFNNSNSAFSDDLNLKEEIKFADEPEILNVESEIKKIKLKLTSYKTVKEY